MSNSLFCNLKNEERNIKIKSKHLINTPDETEISVAFAEILISKYQKIKISFKKLNLAKIFYHGA